MKTQIRELINGKELPAWEHARAVFHATWNTPEKQALTDNKSKVEAIKARLATETKPQRVQKLHYNSDTKAWEFA